MSDVQVTGLYSGIDWGGLLDETINSKRAVEADWYAEQEEIDMQVLLYQELDVDISSLRSSLDPLKRESTFLAKSADITSLSGSENAFTFTAKPDAEIAKYDLETLSVAREHSLASNRVDDTGAQLGHAGSFTLSVGEVDISVEVESTDNLQDIAEAINNAAQDWASENDLGLPLMAELRDNTLVLTSGTTGTAAAITAADDSGTVLKSIGVLDETGAFARELQSASDAKIKLDGLEITRSSNTIDDVIDGVTIEVNGIGEAKVDVTLDAETAVNSIKSMIEAYNTTLDWINTRLTENTVEDAESETEKKWGQLHGDTLLWSCKQEMRGITGNYHSELDGRFKTLSSVGISTESVDFGKSGKLEFDEATFMEAMLEDPESVSELINTMATELHEFSESMISDSTMSVGGKTVKEGRLSSRIDSLETRSDEIDQRIEDWEAQLAMERATLEARYVAMETTLAEISQNSGYLSALSSMNFSSGE